MKDQGLLSDKVLQRFTYFS